MCSSHLRSFRVGVLWQGPARGSWSPAAAPAAAAPRRCRRSRWPRPAAPRWRARRKKRRDKNDRNPGKRWWYSNFYVYIHIYILYKFIYVNINQIVLFVLKVQGACGWKMGKIAPTTRQCLSLFGGRIVFFSRRKSWLIGFRNKPLEWDGHKPNQVVEKTTQPVSASSI